MDKEEFISAIMFVIVFVGGIVLTATIASTETEQKVVNQLCQKQQYDFCEIDGYKMKGTQNDERRRKRVAKSFHF